MLTKKDIQNLADLARLKIPEAEQEGLRREIDSILGYISEVQKVSGKELKKEAGEVRNVFRDDKNPHISGEYTEGLLSEAPRRQDNYVKVKRIL